MKAGHYISLNVMLTTNDKKKYPSNLNNTINVRDAYDSLSLKYRNIP